MSKKRNEEKYQDRMRIKDLHDGLIPVTSSAALPVRSIAHRFEPQDEPFTNIPNRRFLIPVPALIDELLDRPHLLDPVR